MWWKKLSLYLQIIHKGIVTYISILSARKRIVKLNAGRDIWAKPHWKIFFLITKVFLHQLESICSSSFVGFIHPLLPDRLSYGYRNLFDVLNNKYQCCTIQIRISSNTADLLILLHIFVNFFVGFISTDIDECVGGSHSCSPDAYCNNTKGSYNCTCKPGFTGSGRECEGMCYFWEYWAKEADFLISNFLIKQKLRLPWY